MAKKPTAATSTLSGLSERNYEPIKVRDANGKAKVSRGNGDAVARALISLDAKALNAVVKENGLTDKHKNRVAESPNMGLARMSIGNSLRAMVRRGEHVVIAGLTIKSLDQNVKVPGIETEAAEPATRRRRNKAA